MINGTDKKLSLDDGNDAKEAGAGGRSCVNTCSDGFRSIQGSYLAPGDVLDANNQITIKFLKDNSTGDWGVYVGPGVGDTYLSRIGYFPKYLFTRLADSGNYAEFGGAIKFLSSLKSPPMGNGIYAKELQRNGDPLPAIMKNIYYIRPDGWYLARYYSRHSYQNCYGLGKLMVQDNSFGYGGPGGCS
ncbi:putative ZmEBE-1 protein [Carex littledalei]|uniref:Putative ZmEBE-1 protein n=1 Tax=Carex littledalei TaxID=544730 RepID=A0A833QXY2_9POAL|nr:putative ZmEBE-1 protein [Carex littledalei]